MADAVVGRSPVVQPVETVFRMHYGFLAILLGWFVTFLTFCATLASFMAISAMVANSETGLGGFSLLVIVVIYGFLPGLLIGLPLGALTGWPLQRIRNQWWHVSIHAVVTGTVTMAIGLLLGGPDGFQGMLLFGAIAAFSAAVGRASVIRMVARRNAV